MRLHKVYLPLLICAALGTATAAPTFEVRGGERQGAVAGLALDTVVTLERHMDVPRGTYLTYDFGLGVLLEAGEDGYRAALGRAVYLYPAGKATVYTGLDLGIAREEQDSTVPVKAVPPDGRHGRRYGTVATVTDEHTGLVLGAVLGLRGAFSPRVGYFAEVLARDAEFSDGAGVAVGFRFTP